MDPLLDVVVPVHNNPSWLELCVKSLVAHTRNPFQLILVDNASTCERTKRLLDEFESDGHVVVHLAENKCFASSVNAGALAGTADRLVIGNSDVIFQEGWDEHFLQDLTDPLVGLVGASTNYASGLQGWEASKNHGQEPPFLIFFCVGMRRDVFDEVGLLDEKTFNDWAGGEDLDYSWRVRQAGYKLAISRSYVLHAGSRTYKKLGVDNFELSAVAHNRLVAKWGYEHVVRESKTTPTVAICTLSGENTCSIEFAKSLKVLRTGGLPCKVIWISRTNHAHARNALAAEALHSGHDYVLMVDDDMIFPPDALVRLLSHQKDVVGALAYMRLPPHLPCIFQWSREAEGFINMSGYEDCGLVRVDGTGFGMVLMRTEIFKRLPQPWFEWTDKFGEDLNFCRKLMDHGIEAYCDTGLQLGHVGEPVIVTSDYVRQWNAANNTPQSGIAIP